MLQGKLNTTIKMKKPEPLGYELPKPNGLWLLCRMLKADNMVSGVMVNAEENEAGFTIAKVEKIGSLAYQSDKFVGNVFCKEGDYVMYNRFQGLDFEFKGEIFKLLQDDRPVLTFTEQQMIDYGFFKTDEEIAKDKKDIEDNLEKLKARIKEPNLSDYERNQVERYIRDTEKQLAVTNEEPIAKAQHNTLEFNKTNKSVLIK